MLLRRFFPGGSASSSSSGYSASRWPSISSASAFILLAALLALPADAGDVLKTNGFSTCLDSDDIVVNKMNIEYDKTTQVVKYDIAGTSKREQKVKLKLSVTAYGRDVYSDTFDPCEKNIDRLCPLPKDSFSATSSMNVAQFADQIPAIAFQIPNLDGVAKLELLSADDDSELACLKSVVNNGKTAEQTAAKYATAGIAAAALALSGVSSIASAGAGASGAHSGPSPHISDVIMTFQGFAMNGMLSVSYPSVYRSFTQNFAWSTGLVTWEGMQASIDNFRKTSGGNTTQMSIEYLMNSTLVYESEDDSSSNTSTTKRSLYPRANLWARDDNSTKSESSVMRYVHGVQAQVETYKIPSANTFMTVLLIFAIVIASIAVAILLFKVILEGWALFASFPKCLVGFRKRYWIFLSTTIVRLILILYGTWVLYCLYQFSEGDSWGAHVLAGLTLATFTGVLAFFAWRIWSTAQKAKKTEGGAETLYEHKPNLRKYGLFYDQYKSNFWWVFIPLIGYAFAKGAFIALGDGHGLTQTIGQLACELFLLVLLLWNRPYNTRAGNVLNIIIAVVRVLSVACLIVFVDQLGIAADTKTVTGVALIAIQSTLTAALAILIAVNAIIVMVRENPHRKKRKQQMEKEGDLTPLDARNSLLSGGLADDGKGRYSKTPTEEHYSHGMVESNNYALHHMTPAPERGNDAYYHQRNMSAASRSGLMGSAQPMARSQTPDGYEEYRGQYPPQEQHVGVARGY